MHPILSKIYFSGWLLQRGTQVKPCPWFNMWKEHIIGKGDKNIARNAKAALHIYLLISLKCQA